jgi:OmpA-OmpF porin, OOP family
VLTVALGLCLIAALPAAAQTDVDGSKDYPGLNRMPGFYINDYEDLDFGMFEFLETAETSKRVEGHYYRVAYALNEGARNPGAIGIGRNYANAIVAKGGKKLAETLSNYGGSVSATWKANGRSIWIQVDVNNEGRNYTLHVVEEEAMKQTVEFTATELGRMLDETGSVAVHGILFDTGKATIKPESAPVLAQIAELLASNDALTLEIQGHTDNVGTKAANLALSQGRAAAVKDYLVKTHQIAAGRLTTAGFGDTKPVGDNATDEGKALNRRVELVKKS